MWLDRIIRMASLLALLAFVLLNRRCERKGGDVGEATQRAEELAARPDVVEAVVVKAGVVAHAKKGGKAKAKYVPPEGRTEIALTRGGEIEVRTFDAGWSFSLGVGPAVDTRGALRLGLMGKTFYKGRWGLEAGVLLGKRPAVAGAAGLSYQPDWWARNTAVLAGYSTRQTIFAALVVRF